MIKSLWIACAATASLTAQRTWVVDSQNGPGTNFLDLPPALAASNHGDTILVRGPGPVPFYTGGQTSKGIALVGVAAPALGLDFQSPYDLLVTALPAGQTFTMKGFGSTQAFSYGLRLQLSSCAGRVHLEDIFQPQPALLANTLTIQSCAHVTTLRCQFGALSLAGGPPVRIGQSVVAMTETIATGPTASVPYYHGSCFSSVPSAPAIEASGANSVLTLAGGVFTGGSDATCFQGPLYEPASPAILQTNGILMLATATRCVAGAAAMVAIRSDAGVVMVDPRAQLLPSGGSRPIGGTSQVVTWNAPYLTGMGAPANGLAPLDLLGRSGDVAVLLASRPAGPIAVLPFGWFWLSPSAFSIGATVIGTSEHWQLSLPVPPGTPDGMPFAFQAITLTGPGLVPALSNPLVLVLH